MYLNLRLLMLNFDIFLIFIKISVEKPLGRANGVIKIYSIHRAYQIKKKSLCPKTICQKISKSKKIFFFYFVRFFTVFSKNQVKY
jgi:hypothetical protein